MELKVFCKRRRKEGQKVEIILDGIERMRHYMTIGIVLKFTEIILDGIESGDYNALWGHTNAYK